MNTTKTKNITTKPTKSKKDDVTLDVVIMMLRSTIDHALKLGMEIQAAGESDENGLPVLWIGLPGLTLDDLTGENTKEQNHV